MDSSHAGSYKKLLTRTQFKILRQLKNRRDQGISQIASSIFQAFTPENKQQLIREALASANGDRSLGCLVGLAVGDWVGVPLEFVSVVDGTQPPASSWDPEAFDYVNPNRSERERGVVLFGQWSDDTSMALCLADSLILKEEYDGTDVRERYWTWHAEGLNNCFRFDTQRKKRTSFGLGSNICLSLLALKPSEPVTPAFESQAKDAGNGSLMRLAPIPIFFRKNISRALLASESSSLSTHPGSLASEACKFLSFIIIKSITCLDKTIDIQPFLDGVCKEYSQLVVASKVEKDVLNAMIELIESAPKRPQEACWNWKEGNYHEQIRVCLEARGDTYNGYPVKKTYFGSFCMDGLAMALWSVYHSTSFEDAIVKSVNLLGDADTVGAIAGQIAGAIYGFNAIPSRYVEKINKWDDHEISCRAALLHLLGNE